MQRFLKMCFLIHLAHFDQFHLDDFIQIKLAVGPAILCVCVSPCWLIFIYSTLASVSCIHVQKNMKWKYFIKNVKRIKCSSCWSAFSCSLSAIQSEKVGTAAKTPPSHHLSGHWQRVHPLSLCVCLSGSVSHSWLHPKVGKGRWDGHTRREVLKDKTGGWWMGHIIKLRYETHSSSYQLLGH